MLPIVSFYDHHIWACKSIQSSILWQIGGKGVRGSLHLDSAMQKDGKGPGFFGPWSQSWSLVQSQSWSLMMGIGAPLAPFSEKVQINNDTKMVSSRQTILEDQGKLQMSREPTKLSAFCQSSIKDFEIRIPYNCPDPSLLRCWLQWLQSDHFKGISAEYAYTWSNILQICN